MKAEEIRKLELIEDTRSGERIFRDEPFFLQEIAAQLADLNEWVHSVGDVLQEISVDVAELNSQLRKSKTGPGQN